jgi:CubicO group peptidase (beta-lactamase class C family)
MLIAGLACTESPTRPAPSYTYEVPPETGDGWTTAHLDAVGLREEPLAELVERVRDGSYVNIHGVLLVRAGRLVLEEYARGRTTTGERFVDWSRDDLHDLHSVTKSVNSLLMGIALDQGLIEDVDQRISAFFPEHAALFADERKGALTLEHFLTMTAGLQWDEHSYSYADSRNSHVQLHRSGDPVAFTLGLPVVDEPGRRFRYNSGLSITLGEVINRASGLKADEFAERFLFGPLGISDYAWWRYPDGTVQTGGGLALRPRDAAKVGQLMLNGGTWQGERIVSASWVRESTTEHAPGAGYGYQWWRIRLPRHEHPFDLSDEVFDVVAASGRGGQWIFVYPEQDLVAVFTGGNDNVLSNQAMDMLRRYVFPAVQ